MTAIMQGVRILEVAEHTFVPAASALLADCGAEVIKIEPMERGDAMRGLAAAGRGAPSRATCTPCSSTRTGESSSLALDLTTDEGLDILYKLAATADVFLTNKLPRVRKKLKIELEDIRAAQPQIIYVARDRSGRTRSGCRQGFLRLARLLVPRRRGHGGEAGRFGPFRPRRRPGFGDSIGAMTIAGGIMGALYHREKTGEATTVDVSLLGTGMWAMGQAFALSLVMDVPWHGPPTDALYARTRW